MSSNLSNIYNSELIVAAWVSVSLVLLTASLLFYHMTRKQTLLLNPRLAGIFAVSLIILAIALSIFSIIDYRQRVLRAAKYTNSPDINQEKHFSIGIVVICSVLALVEIAIATTIMIGSFK